MIDISSRVRNIIKSSHVHLPGAKKSNQTHVNPRFRAYGRARVEIFNQVTSQQDWIRLWKPATHPFPFFWADAWKTTFEFEVNDYPSEVGFFTDILGLTVDEFGEEFVRFILPEAAICLTVKHNPSTPFPVDPSMRLQIHINRLTETISELKNRGVKFTQLPSEIQTGTGEAKATLITPNGVSIDLIGEYTAPQVTELPDNYYISPGIHEKDIAQPASDIKETEADLSKALPLPSQEISYEPVEAQLNIQTKRDRSSSNHASSSFNKPVILK
jgi:hypothetical protein